MNPAKAKIDALRSSAALINPKNRRKIIEDEVRPTLEALKSDWNHFAWGQERVSQQIGTLETWATVIWKKAECEMNVGKFLSELQKLVANLKQ